LETLPAIYLEIVSGLDVDFAPKMVEVVMGANSPKDKILASMIEVPDDFQIDIVKLSVTIRAVRLKYHVMNHLLFFHFVSIISDLRPIATGQQHETRCEAAH
jgi:hypothetical protein